MLTYLIDWLDSELETALGFEVIKSFPIWRRPGVTATETTSATLPTGSLFVAESVFNPQLKRLGGTVGQRQAVFELYIFCSHERELCTALDNLATWISERGTAQDVNSIRVALQLTTANRLPNDQGLQQEEHAFFCPLQITWSD